MGGMYPSSVPAKFGFTRPQGINTNVAGGDVTYTDDTDLSHWVLSVYDNMGTTVFNAACSTLPDAEITMVLSGEVFSFSIGPAALTGKQAGTWWAILICTSGSSVKFPATSTSFQWGGFADLLTQVPAQNTRSMLNNGQSYRQIENPPWLFPAIINPATGLAGTSGSLTVIDPHFTGSSVPVSLVANTLWMNTGNATFTTSGSYLGILTQTNNGIDYKSIGYISWGGTGTVALATAQDIGDTLAATRKAVKASAGNSSFDTGTGVVDFGSGDTFILVDGSNNPVSSPQNAVARSGSTF